jgi:TRAP-type C4-dicarboxylate transport system permease small subunit
VIARLRRALGAADGWVRRAEMGALGALMAALTAVTFLQVVMRYVFNDPLTWSEELARYLFVWVSLIGAGAAVGRGGHYGMETLEQRVPRAVHRFLGAMAMLIVLAFAVALLVTGLQETALAARQLSWSMPIRMHWAYAALPAGAALMLWHIAMLWLRHGFGRHPLDHE